ncbi:hypothetical protein IHV10_10375 [Fictibacillus sp. 5RED26]|uniref:hypothetical protein n=1 Tax=Fictibacillus sp. 5RED26 TaxID=2745876 RepID=UPI0018CFBE3A|nr:hypothetical protein [Fictibacillus sp. 5RED26]MBH0156774.1 hypothetical protein [Fictibacillus sp. 5RED26]
MANKRVFKVATASAVAASALVAAVPASAASVTYEQAEKQVNVAREAANGLHAEYTKNADYKTKVDIKEANDELNRAKAKIAALSDAKQKAYLSSRIQGTIDTVARANAYNNAVRVGTEILPAAHQAVVKAADVESLKEGNVLLAAKIKQAKETFPKVYGKEMQTSFATMYLTAELEADRKDGHYAAITADRVAEGLKLIAAGKVEEAEVQYKNAEASFKAVKGLATIKEIIAADWTELGKKIEAAKVAKVESVSAINAKTIVVKFNSELTDDNTVVGDASEVAKYTLDGINPATAKLSSDKKTVTLTFAADVEGTDQVLVVNPVVTTKKDKDGNAVSTEKYTKVLSYTDEVKPEVVGTSYENGKIVVSYSEAIGTKPAVVRVNGNPVAAADIAISLTDSTKVEINYAGLAASTTASLYVAGAKDASAAGNEMSLFNGTVITPAADTAKPQITGVQVTGQNTAKVTLSEAITQNTVAAKLQKGATQTDVSLVKDLTDTTGKTYTLAVDLNGATAGDGIFAGTSTSESFTLYVAAGAMTDTSTPANANELFSTNLTFVKDVTAPALVSSQTSADSKKLEFKFNEDLTVAGLDANIIIKNADGVRISAVDAETALKVGDNKTYQVDTKAGDVVLDAGTYTVTIPAGFFTDALGNASTAVTSTFTVGAPTNNDTTKPTGAVTTADTNVFQVVYSEEVTATALNLSNYKLDGASLPAGTEIYFTSTAKDTVKIVLPTGSINIGNQTTGASAILTVSNVADKAGNVIATANTSVVVKDNTSASVTNVQVLGTDVYVTFNENITVPGTTNALDAFKVTVNGTELLAADVSDLVEVSGNAKQVKFTLATAATPVVSVKAAQAVLKDANGVLVK